VTSREAIVDLEERRGEALTAGSDRSVERQHARGKLTARERIELLLDPGTFIETNTLMRTPHNGEADQKRPYGDGVITGRGLVHGRVVCVFAQDFTVFGGSLGETFGRRVAQIMDLAESIGCPIIGLNDSGGARIQEGVAALYYYAELGKRNVELSGKIPQISVIMGPCAGGAVYSPAMTDFTLMVEGTSHMFVTGPDVVKQVTGEDTTFDELGGAEANALAGNAHFVGESDEEILQITRDLLSYLPQNHAELPPVYGSALTDTITDRDIELDTILPDSTNKAYDMGNIIRGIVDDDDFLEIQPEFGRSALIGLGRIDGQTVGVIANQPRFNAGAMNIDSNEKCAAFVRFCDSFNIPMITLVDVPGYLPGLDQERQGVIRRGAKLFYAYTEATVPMITVVIRKAYGGAYASMCSKSSGCDLYLAWPSAEIAVMGAESAVLVRHGRRLKQALEEGNVAEVHAELLADYIATHNTPYLAAQRGFVDGVIEPRETRREISRGLKMLAGKHVPSTTKKHGNIPL
jgi:propionyl-CoA carboxylase beta chain